MVGQAYSGKDSHRDQTVEMNEARTISGTYSEKRLTEMYNLMVSVPNMEALALDGREMVEVRVQEQVVVFELVGSSNESTRLNGFYLISNTWGKIIYSPSINPTRRCLAIKQLHAINGEKVYCVVDTNVTISESCEIFGT